MRACGVEGFKRNVRNRKSTPAVQLWLSVEVVFLKRAEANGRRAPPLRVGLNETAVLALRPLSGTAVHIRREQGRSETKTSLINQLQERSRGFMMFYITLNRERVCG